MSNDSLKTDDYIEQATGALSVGNLPRAIGLILQDLKRRPPEAPAWIVQQTPEPLELLIHCPRCKVQHVDEGEFATRAHKDHACQGCGLVFRPCKQPSIGVQFFSGYRNPKPV